MIQLLILSILTLSLIYLFISNYDIIIDYEINYEINYEEFLDRPDYGFSTDQYSDHYFYQYLDKLDYSLKIVNRYHIPEATQGVIVTGTYFYAISNSMIGKYYKNNGLHIKTFLTDFTHFNGGITYNGNLYLTHNPPNNHNNNNNNNNNYTNSVVIFNVNMEYLYSIDIPPFYPSDGQYDFNNRIVKYDLNKDLFGSLTWIDRFDGYWWGCFAFYKDNVYKTRVVKFEEGWKGWSVQRSWMLPTEVLDRLHPWSISGGQFHTKSGLLFLTGHSKKEIYITQIVQDETVDVLKLITIIPTPFEGQGISFDTSNAGSDYLWGIKRSSREVIISRLEYI